VRPAHFGDKVLKGAKIVTAGNLAEIYDRLISFWPDPTGLVTGSTQASGWLDRLTDSMTGLSPVSRLRLCDLMGYLPDDILTKVDRASMAVSLEVRVPLLDHRVVEFSWSLPPDQLIFDRRGKQPLRAVLERRLPKELFDRPKKGFGVPIGAWLRGPLREWAGDLLVANAIKEHGFFRPEFITKCWDEHQSGRRNWQHALWAVVQFQAWHREWAEGSPRAG
jgi:asparagine synthase (glutamine-hydrolysing)